MTVQRLGDQDSPLPTNEEKGRVVPASEVFTGAKLAKDTIYMNLEAGVSLRTCCMQR
jgi:hypothetical protein